MAKVHVRADDARKEAITRALKRKSGGNKITMVTEHTPDPRNGNAHLFSGSCMVYEPETGKYRDLGMHHVYADEIPGISKVSA